MPEGIINCKDTVPVLSIDDFSRHGKGAVDGVLIAAGGAEAALTTKRDKLEIAAFFTSPHDTAITGVTTVKHLLDILYN